MKNRILFQETQRFNQWWIWAILVCTNVFVAFTYWKPILENTDSIDVQKAILITAVQVLTFVLFLFIKLETRITEDGVEVRLFPFHLNFKKYNWNEIENKEVRTYNPILEYGGWGLRGIGKNKAYNISGNRGLQLVFSNGKRLLLGTQKPDEISQALEKI